MFSYESEPTCVCSLVFLENGWKWKDPREMCRYHTLPTPTAPIIFNVLAFALPVEPFFKHAYMRKQQPMFRREMRKLIQCFERDMKKNPSGFDVQELFLRLTF